MIFNAMVDMAGEAFLHVRAVEIYEDITHIAVGIVLRGECGRGCERCSVSGEVNLCHWMQNSKEADPICFSQRLGLRAQCQCVCLYDRSSIPRVQGAYKLGLAILICIAKPHWLANRLEIK